MTRVYQTKFHSGESRGNCWAAVVASYLDLDISEIPAFEEMMPFDNPDVNANKAWIDASMDFLSARGYVWGSLEEHDEGFYIVIGRSPRGDFNHCCIYKDGQLWHDPHPDGGGLLTETHFEFIDPITS